MMGKKMETIQATIELPKTFPFATKVKENEMSKFLRHTIATELYREGRVSLGSAAEIAGARNKWEMLTILKEKKVPIDYTAEDAEKDLKTLKRVLGRE